MNPTAKNILAFVVGAVVAMAVNMGLIVGLSKLVPLPEGVDVNKMETIKENIHKFEPKHFAVPFLAHALGSVAGAFTAAMLAASHRFGLAMSVGGLHLAGGISAVAMIPAPLWFNALDLIGAYIPMAWIGYKIAEVVRPESPGAAAVT